MRGLLGKSQQEEHNAIHHAGLPVLVIWGRDDTVIPLTAAGTLTSWSPTTVQVIVDNAGHGLPYIHPTQVLEIIRKAMSASKLSSGLR